MQDIEKQVLKTFQENLLYLEKNHKDMHHKINLLGALIEEGKHVEQYSLEYMDEGYFDIKELSSGNFLYGENSIQSGQRMVDGFDLKRTGAIFKGQKFIRVSDQQVDIVEQNELSFHNAVWATARIINYVSKHAAADSYMKRVHKIIFLGFGLGLHIQGIVKKYNPQVVFIKEANLETFRLSLFVTNLQEALGDSAIYLSLSSDKDEQREHFIEFLNTGNNYNLNLKHIPFTQDYQQDLQDLQSHVLSQSYINYGHSAMLLRFIDSPRYLVQGCSFLNMMKRYYDLEGNVLTKKPVLLLFSGPSTSKNIKWIEENRDRFIVVSALSTCRLLKSVNITPDIVIHIDPGENSALLFEGLTEDYFKETLTILASNVDEKTMKRFNKDKVHFIQQGTNYKKGFGHFSAPSVGEYTYGLFLVLGISKMYMLGIDLALDPDTLQTHGGFHPYQTTGKLDTQSASLDPSSSSQYVKGNFLDQIPTLSSYTLSIEQAKIYTQTLKKEHHHVYNLSNGAYLEGCEPLHIEDFDWTKLEKLNRDKTKEEIDLFFKQIADAQFNAEDRALIKYQIKEARKLEKLIKAYKKKRFINANAYLKSTAQLSWDLSDMDYKTNSDLAQVYYEYFSIVLSYLFDLFNTKELVKPDRHVIEISSILAKQLLKISKLYITRLEEYLK